jgi:predicted enzyme related to lactoylglutathione lyase
MSSEVIALGWYVRFVPVDVMDAMSDYYANAIALPHLLKWRKPKGDVENKDYFWGGEAVIVDHNYGGGGMPPDSREGDPDTARQIEIFRVSDIDSVVRGLIERGADVLPIRPCYHGREAFVRDPMGMLIGIRERDADSPLPQDREATRRRLRGEAFNPGCTPMPENWQEVGWVRIRVADLPRAKAFYGDIIGLPVIAEPDGCVLLDLGDNTTLELAPGGAPRDPPARQMESLMTMILRVSEVAETVKAYKAAGVHFVHDMLTSPKGDWTYIADPEGNVIGVSTRNPPKDYLGKFPVYAEDLEAARRWAETKAARAGIR